MQFTNQYKLNLIEATDTFSPAPLNENMEKVEAALEGMAESQSGLNEQLSALAQAIAACGNCTIECGTFVGNSTDNRAITLGYRPKLLILLGQSSAAPMLTVAADGCVRTLHGEYALSDGSDNVAFTDTGFTVKRKYFHNYDGQTEYYVAFH